MADRSMSKNNLAKRVYAAARETFRSSRESTRSAMVEFVKAHAVEHYEDGWDVVVECWTDEQIGEQIAGATTKEQALAAFAPLVNVRNSAFLTRWSEAPR